MSIWYLGATLPTYDPNISSAGGTRCLHANIRLSIGDQPTAHSYAVADTLAPFTPGKWNKILSPFNVNDSMIAVEQIAFDVDGIIGGVKIMIDNVYVTKPQKIEDSSCL